MAYKYDKTPDDDDDDKAKSKAAKNDKSEAKGKEAAAPHKDPANYVVDREFTDANGMVHKAGDVVTGLSQVEIAKYAESGEIRAKTPAPGTAPTPGQAPPAPTSQTPQPAT